MHWAEFNQESQLEDEFVKEFGVPFDSVTNVDVLTNSSYDDGVTHYINMQTKDVYSYDMFKRKWLEKNKKKDEVLKRLVE
jgi:hypothetical protein